MGQKPSIPLGSSGEAGQKSLRLRMVDRIRTIESAISATIPGTSAFEKRRQEITERLTQYHKGHIDGLNALDPETKQRLSDRFLYHIGRLEAIEALSEIFPVLGSIDASVPLFALGLLSSVLVALLWPDVQHPWWAVILIVFLCAAFYLVMLFVVSLLAFVPVMPIKYFAPNSDLVWLLILTGMAMAVMVYRQGYLQRQNALGVLGYPVSETVASWTIVTAGCLYLLSLIYVMVRDVIREKRWVTLLKGLLRPDDLLALLAGIALVGFPLYHSRWMVGSNPVSILNSAAIAGLFGALVFWILMGVLVILLTLIGFVVTRHKNRRYPDSALVYELFWILWSLEKMPDEWQNTKFKQGILSQLENAATAVGRISQDLPCYDAATEAWSVEEFQKKAAFLRYLKTWVLTPKADTQTVFTRRIAREFAHAVEGNWDALAKPEDGKVLDRYFTSRRGHSLVISLLRGSFRLLTGFIPLGGILALQQTVFALDSSVANYVTVSAAIWAIVRVLQIIDPDFEKTFKTAREMQKEYRL